MRARAALALVLLLGGCFPGYVHVTVRADPATNDGKPLFMLVRKVLRPVYLAESYQAVSAKIVDNDESVLENKVIYPGRTLHLFIKEPKKESLGVYFFFSSPRPGWRMLIERPLPLTAGVDLGRDGIRE